MGHPEAVQRHPQYLALFGSPAQSLAVYAHHHDHSHDSHGDVVAPPGAGRAGRDG
jgi:zinc transport system ATP-binding protein